MGLVKIPGDTFIKVEPMAIMPDGAWAPPATTERFIWSAFMPTVTVTTPDDLDQAAFQALVATATGIPADAFRLQTQNGVDFQLHIAGRGGAPKRAKAKATPPAKRQKRNATPVAAVEPDYVVTIAAAPLVAAVPAPALPGGTAVNPDVNPPVAGANPGDPATTNPPVEAAGSAVDTPGGLIAGVQTFIQNAMLALKADIAATMKDNRNDILSTVQAELAASQGGPNPQGLAAAVGHQPASAVNRATSAAATVEPAPPIHVVTITGGPGGGKSTALHPIAQLLRETGEVEVVTVTEEPTDLFRSIGGSPTDPVRARLVQKLLLRRTLAAHKAALEAAAIPNRDNLPVIILKDRGPLDGKAFCTRAEWSNCLRSERVDDTTLLDEAGLILHFRSTATDRPELYDYGPGSSNPERHTTLPDAFTADAKLYQVYTDAAVRHTVTNIGHTMDDKIHFGLNMICQFVNIEPPLIYPHRAETEGYPGLGRRVPLPLRRSPQNLGPAGSDTAAAAAAAAGPNLVQMGPADATTAAAAATATGPDMAPMDDDFRERLRELLAAGATSASLRQHFEGTAVPLGSEGDSATLATLARWGARDGAGAPPPGFANPPLVGYGGRLPTITIPVLDGEAPMLLIGLFTETATSGSDAALGLRPLALPANDQEEIVPGVYRKAKKTYADLEQPADAMAYRRAADYLHKYAVFHQYFTPQEADDHLYYVDTICRYMLGSGPTAVGIQPFEAVRAFDDTFRRQQHAKTLALGFRDDAVKAVTHHFILPATSRLTQPAPPPATSATAGVTKRTATTTVTTNMSLEEKRKLLRTDWATMTHYEKTQLVSNKMVTEKPGDTPTRICFGFNITKCSGQCTYAHACGLCGKFGHTMSECA